jgi:GT2 family glycosyltransferase
LPVYHNDTELCWRIQHRLKKKLWIAKEAFLWHYGKVTVNDLNAVDYENMKHHSEKVLKELWPEIAGEMSFG